MEPPAHDANPATASETHAHAQSIPTWQAGCPLRREGARYFLSAAEQALQDAMNRSSPIPEPVLGKRARQVDEPQDGDDTDQDEQPSSAIQPQSAVPSISNVTAAALRYTTKKKLRPEQRDEVEALLLVSTSCIMSWVLVS